MAAETADVIQFHPRRGRPSSSTYSVMRGALEHQRAEIAALRKEARQLVAAALPLARRLEVVTYEVGPVAHQTAAALIHRLLRYEARNSGPRDAA